MSHRSLVNLVAVIALSLTAVPAAADEIGGGGFNVPQDEWLWGIEGLTRTPLDLSANFGGTFYDDYEMKSVAVHVENRGPSYPGSLSDSFVAERDGDLQFDPQGIQAGFRFGGGLGFWQCCVMIEPAMAFWWNRPLGSGDSSRGRSALDPDDANERSRPQVELKRGWDLAFGPQMTWIIREDIPVIGEFLGGLPLVFFPFVGVSHSEFDAELQITDPDGDMGGPGVFVQDRNFEEDMFMVGFDLDIPLPGSQGPFTHALTFGFKWVDGNEKHDMTVFGNTSPTAPSSIQIPFEEEDRIFVFKSLEGARFELRYTVYWNDFEGFFKRHIFGPAS